MSILSAIKIFTSLWPFIKEMFFAEKSLKQIIVDNKFAVVLFLVLALSLSLNYLSFSKIYEMAVVKKEDDAKLSAKNKQLEKPAHAASAPASAPPDDYDHIQNRLHEIYGDHP